jgi:hypothetical protein
MVESKDHGVTSYRRLRTVVYLYYACQINAITTSAKSICHTCDSRAESCKQLKQGFKLCRVPTPIGTSELSRAKWRLSPDHCQPALGLYKLPGSVMVSPTPPQLCQSVHNPSIQVQPSPRSIHSTPRLISTTNLLIPSLFAFLLAIQKIQRCVRPVPQTLQPYTPSPELVTPQEMVSHCDRESSCLRRVSFRPIQSISAAERLPQCIFE